MDIIEVMQSENMEEIIDRLNAYAISCLGTVGLKSFNGKEPVDFVGDLILKVMEGRRDWSKAKCSFTEFLFGSLKSEINNFFKTSRYVIYTDELPEIPSSNTESVNIEQKRKQVSELLKQNGADNDELIIFECWMEGMSKPAEIAKDLGIDVKQVYNISKRLERRLPKIQTHVKNLL